jgi:hypothetical protein
MVKDALGSSTNDFAAGMALRCPLKSSTPFGYPVVTTARKKWGSVCPCQSVRCSPKSFAIVNESAVSPHGDRSGKMGSELPKKIVSWCKRDALTTAPNARRSGNYQSVKVKQVEWYG